MTQIPAIQIPPYQIPSQPNYNAVKIDIHNPQVNTNAPAQTPILPNNYTAPIYSYPQVPVYEMPQQSVYKQPEQPQNINKPESIQEVPIAVTAAPTVPVPPPVIVQSTVTQVPVVKPAEAKAPIVETPVAPVAPAQAVEVKAPEVIAPKVDLNEFIAKLKSSDYEQQAKAMDSIAEIANNSPQQAVDLLDVRIIDTLLGIMNNDSSKLTGPTPQQLQIREKIMGGQKVSDAEMAEANKITPMEQAERNKLYAIYTVTTLQKLYSSEIEKMNNTVVPLTELPGAAGIVEQIKNNPNPMVRTTGINVLSSIQRSEYKKDLTTLFSIAKNDKDTSVQQAAAKALEKLAQVADVTEPAPTTEAQKAK